jgi:hypothetical protein
MGSEITPAALNPSQMRGVSSTLRLVEHAVDQIERLLIEPVTRITFCLTDDLDAEERRAIHAACDRLRATLGETCRRLGVEVAERSRRRKIRGEVSMVWAMLEDTKSPALRGYGPVSPDAGKIVDELLEKIAVDIVGILRLVARRRPGAVMQA